MSAEKSLRVAVIGARGRLGSAAVEVLRASPEFELVLELGSADDVPAALRRGRPEVALDVTRAGLGFEHGKLLLEHGVRPVIGTSGVSLDENGALDALARERGLGGLVVPNFSLGMWLLQKAAVEAARYFEQVEILEMHHEKKRDAPSGTSLDTAERMRAARASPGAPIPIHSVRLPGLYAHQVVVCGSAGEVYSLRHDMSGPQAFGPGIQAAVRYASRATGVGRGIGIAFEAARPG